jgi:tetraacyldisaccharide 4'-kinase
MRQIYSTLGRPFSPIYSFAMRLREHGYRQGLFKSTAFAVPVVSIGNLTLGGSGKTPLVQHFARLLQQEGYRPAIISRGYGGATKERVNVVSNGRQVLLPASYVGDEPRMLAENLPGVLVLTGVVRRLPAAEAVCMGADVLLLDDGFQHLAIQRDLDLVLFNADALAGNSRVFPGGDLREPVNALARCHAFVLTGAESHNVQRATRFGDLLRKKFPEKPIFLSSYKPKGLMRYQPGQAKSMVGNKALAGRRCLAFCGLARPEAFQKTLEDLGIHPLAFKALPDHHVYSERTVNQLLREAQSLGADSLICTEKDLVKIAEKQDLCIPVYGVLMEAGAVEALDQLVLDRVAAKRLPVSKIPQVLH